MTHRRTLFVTCIRPRDHTGYLRVGGALFRCALGRSGLHHVKREGDGASPVGAWPIRYGYFRPDRLRRIGTPVPLYSMHKTDGWCDDPASRHYNCPVRLPASVSAEHLWRDDDIYDVVTVLGHNDRPPIKGRGSAIFFHLAREGYGPTEGCVAVSTRDMRRILSVLRAGDRMQIGR